MGDLLGKMSNIYNYIECIIIEHMTSKFKYCQISQMFIKMFFRFLKIFWYTTQIFSIIFTKLSKNLKNVFYIGELFSKYFKNFKIFYKFFKFYKK